MHILLLVLEVVFLEFFCHFLVVAHCLWYGQHLGIDEAGNCEVLQFLKHGPHRIEIAEGFIGVQGLLGIAGEEGVAVFFAMDGEFASLSELFPTARMRTDEGLGAGVNVDVFSQVLGEGKAFVAVRTPMMSGIEMR